MKLENNLGNFKPGKEADFVILDISGATPLLKRRLALAKTIDDKLFILMMLGDDRSIITTHIMGESVK